MTTIKQTLVHTDIYFVVMTIPGNGPHCTKEQNSLGPYISFEMGNQS